MIQLFNKYFDRKPQIEQWILKESNKKSILNEEQKKKLYSFFSNYIYNQPYYIPKNNIKYCLQLSDNKIFDIIFSLFGREKEKNEIFELEDLEYLYYSFTTDNPNVIGVLISFFIFYNKEKLTYVDINKNTIDIFERDIQTMSQLFELNLKIKEKYEHDIYNINNSDSKAKKKKIKNEEEIFNRKDYINKIKGEDFLQQIKFIKKIYGSNEEKHLFKDRNELDYVCDCRKALMQENIENKLDSMKRAFDIITKDTNNLLNLNNFENILKYNRIHDNFINFVMEYLRKYSQKEFCCFNDLKHIFSKLDYSLSYDEKKKFLFEMILIICGKEGKITDDQVGKYLNSELYDNDNKNKIIQETPEYFDEESFLENNDFDNMIKSNKNIEHFGLIPYLVFKMKANDKNIKRKLVMTYLKNEGINENYEKYLERNFEQNEIFYVINAKFWDSLLDEKKEAYDYIDNSEIAEELNIVKNEEIMQKDIVKLQNEINSQEIKKKQKSNKKNESNKEKEEEPNKNNIKQSKEKNEENNKIEDENTIKMKINPEEETNNKKNVIEIVTKRGKLKKGLKLKENFILLCEDLYQLLKINYQIDYEVILKRKTSYIQLNKNNKNESKEKGNEKEKDINDKEKGEGKEKEEKQKEQNDQDKDKEKESDDNKKIENKENEHEKDEDIIQKEQLIKEKLDKFSIDEEKGLISIIRKNNEEIYSLYELDFYPIKVFIKTFGVMVRLVEKAKANYDDLDNQKRILELPKKQRLKEIQNNDKNKQKLYKRISKYKQLKYDLDEQFQYQQIPQNIYMTKLKKLKEQYKDVFQKKEKTPNDFEVEISLRQFKVYLERYKNTLLLEQDKEIGMYPRNKTYKDILNDIFILDCTLKEQKFDVYYYLFNSKKLIKVNANDKYDLDNEDFINIIVDRYNEKGESFYQLLSEKDGDQNWIEIDEPENDKDKNKNEKDGKALNKDKEKEKQEKAERQRKEKEEKERLKKIKDEEDKKMKEEQKKWEQQEKERKRKEKEEKEKLKKEQKERELEEKRQREREKFISPPFGIHNYGNTCYFNSVNQIFFNLPILQQIFLDPKIDFFVNKENKFGHQGKFFEIYKSLYWIKPTKIGGTVKSLKAIVGELKEDFNNNRQQDANEYLNFVLENLHEELNLHSTKKYIEEKDDIFKHNTMEELGNISWANNLRRNMSFIDSIFMFQLRSNLKCKKCNNVKYNFETNYIFDLPLSLCRMVTVEIYLYRLPFRYKLYFDKINKEFQNYTKREKNQDLNIVENLWNYYTNELKDEQKNQHIIKLHFSFDLERDKNMMDIIKILRGIKILELEPENIIQTYKDEGIIENKVEHLTDLITYSKEKNKIIYPNSEIDKYVNMEDKIILNVYEILNSNGMKKLFEEQNKTKGTIINLNTYSYNYNIHFNADGFRNYFHKTNFSESNNSTIATKPAEKDSISSEIDTNSENKINENENKIIEDQIIDNNNENIINETKNSDKLNIINVISLKDRLIMFPKDNINFEVVKSRKIISEFVLPIFHYNRSYKNSTYLFRDFYHEKLNSFPCQFIILNNLYTISSKQLYEYIWNLNILYMNHPKIDTSKFWWNNDKETSEEENNKNDNTNYKKCYPFVLRYLELPKNPENNNLNLIHCPLCPWYSFCPGCIIDPKGDLKKLDSTKGIVVDWCTSFVQEEFSTYNFKLSKDIESQTISENLPILDKDQAYQSIKDCFDLFFVEENLEDPLMCHQCGGPQDFTKKYTINKLPYVLILSLKRFKFNQNSNFKLRQMITYPLYDLELGGKKYDLYGVVNHYGSLSSGHYTAIIKKNKDWVLCNDSSVSIIEEKRVMHSNAYILFYICKESPYQNDYFKFMKSIMNNIVLKDGKDKKNAILNKDLNFFKGEPVKTPYGEGYVVEENLVDFKADEKHDIYDDLKKKDIKRIEDIVKKEKENEKKNKKEDKKSDKNEDKESKKEEVKDNEKKNEIKDKEESKENNDKKESNEKKEDENKINNNLNEINQFINILINKIINDVVENTEKKDKNEINEINENSNKIEENENNKQKDVDKKEENVIIISNENSINETEEESQISINLNKVEEKVSHSDFYKDFVKVKFDYGEGSILRTRLIKNKHILNGEKDDKKDEKKGEKKNEKNKKK